MQLEESYFKNKKKSKNPLHVYQGQYNKPNKIIRYIIKNYLQ